MSRQGKTGITSIANDPGCVKTLRGITAPGILGPMIMRRLKKRKNFARHYNQIRFRFDRAKTHTRRRIFCGSVTRPSLQLNKISRLPALSKAACSGFVNGDIGEPSFAGAC